MHQRAALFLLVAAGLLFLNLAPVSRAEGGLEEGLDDDLDVEDELDLGLDVWVRHDVDEAHLLGFQVTYKAPEPVGEHFFAESFDRGTLDGWVLSKAKKDAADEEIAKYDGKWAVEEMKDSKLPGDKGLVLKSRAKHHAISARLLRPFTFDTKPLIVQYEVNFQSGIDCGGAYVKLLTETPELNLTDEPQPDVKEEEEEEEEEEKSPGGFIISTFLRLRPFLLANFCFLPAAEKNDEDDEEEEQNEAADEVRSRSAEPHLLLNSPSKRSVFSAEAGR
uniref:Calnexin n=1 Tax=Oryzias latipes TaxID=8090 RepID=A0A3P9HPN4_ORYLA